MSSKKGQNSKGMDLLIRTINKLQDAFTIMGGGSMILPQIAVVGGQSSGKSSVLENIVGRDFLPRGSGIVTRRPLVLQLVNTPTLSKEYGVFLHKKGQKYYDFDAIREEIEADTDRETGFNKGISNRPINLKIFSPNVLNLTLVDLPGITRVPVGDQPEDIEELIRDMVMRYITQPNCIILAVTAANTDIANSDALKCAREVDPEGDRTLGVLTKLDLMDKGTDAMDVITGKLISLKLGYIPVVNRGQADIEGKKDIQAQWQDEKNFFRSHNRYSVISERCGTRFLAKRCNELLLKIIRDKLPEIYTTIQMFVEEKKNELKTLAEVVEEPHMQQQVVLGAFTEFANEFRAALEGVSETAISSDELRGGARIQHIFGDVFKKQINDITFIEELSIPEIRTVIKNCMGVNSNLFIPDKSFEVIIKRAVRLCQAPALLCVQLVNDELITLARDCDTPTLERFTVLRERIIEAVSVLLKRTQEPACDIVRTIIQMELVRINTQHPAFIGKQESVNKVVGAVKKEYEARFAPPEPEPGVEPVDPEEPEILSQNILEGWLSKKGGFRNFHRRHFTLNRRRLIWTQNPDDPMSEVKELDLDASRTEWVERNSRAGKFSFSITTMDPMTRKNEQTILMCDNEETADKWVKACTIAADETAWREWLVPPEEVDEEAEEAPKPEPEPVKVDEHLVTPGEEEFSQKEMVETEVIRRLLINMFDIIRTQLIDMVPKAITLQMLNEAKNQMHGHLVQSLFKPELCAEMLKENENTALTRKDCVEVIDLMEEAINNINEVQRSKIDIKMLD
eukprot:TRINITY_DN13809_c0_g1_i1.p1 TRINITY_DN13809_c0_g1~~TRINITY_DN13809_c0_g1_i1.p1  ORF type:complete len:806 (-),score=292.97 TRINITY_DN13809_c0_g1_i1:149-2539(-)